MRFPSRFRPLRSALLLSAAVLCAPSPGAAQEEVTATSGDPAVIERVEGQVGAIERASRSYRRVARALRGFSLQGGEVEGLYDESGQLRKLRAKHFGDDWRSTEEYYFADGRLVFVETVVERLQGPAYTSTPVRNHYAAPNASRRGDAGPRTAARGERQRYAAPLPPRQGDAGPPSAGRSVKQRFITRSFFDGERLVRQARAFHPMAHPTLVAAHETYTVPAEVFLHNAATLAGCAAAGGPEACTAREGDRWRL